MATSTLRLAAICLALGIVICSAPSPKTDFVFLIYPSQRISKDETVKLKDFMKSLIKDTDVGSGKIRIGVVSFSEGNRGGFELGSFRNKQDILKALDGIELARTTKMKLANILETLQTDVFEQEAGSNTEKVLVIILNGFSESDTEEDIRREGERLRNGNVTVLTIGVREDVDVLKMAAVASHPEKVLVSESLSDVMDLKAGLLDQVPAFQSDVSALKAEAMAAQESVSKELDLVFLLHSSDKMTPSKFVFYKRFMKGILEEAEVDSGRVKVAVATSVRRGTILFSFNKFNTKKKLNAGIDRVRLARPRRNSVYAGMNIVRKKLLTPSGGDRPAAQNMVILVTDTKGNEDQTRLRTSAARLKATGSRVFAIGVGVSDVTELQMIASSPSDVYTISEVEQLESLKQELVYRVPELQALKDEMDDSAYNRKADFVIAYHFQFKTKNFWISKFLKKFLTSLVSKSDMENGNVRVGLVNYAKRTREVVHLNAVSSKKAFAGQVNKISRTLRTRNVDGGAMIKWVDENMFTVANGDRPDVDNYLLILTDGPNTDDTPGFFREATRVKNDGVKIVTVGIWQANMGQLEKVGSEPVSENVIKTNSYKVLPHANTINNIRRTMGFLRDPPKGGGGKPEAPKTIPKLSLRGVNKADIALAIHFNRARSIEDFNKLISYLQYLIATADIDGGKARFAFYVNGNSLPYGLESVTTREQAEKALNFLIENADEILSYDPSGEFDLVELLREARTNIFSSEGDRPDAPNGLIIITDTSSGQGSAEVTSEARKTALANIAVYTMGIGLEDKREMEKVAISADNVFAFSDYADLRLFGAALKKELGVLNTKELPPELRTTEETPEQTTPVTTLPPPLSDCVLGRADLVLIVDSSTSVTQRNFRKILNFVEEFVSKADIDTGNVRVGFMIYSTKVNVQFNLNDYRSKADIMAAVRKTSFTPGQTNTAGALDVVRNKMFAPDKGDRPSVENVVVMLTDGVSTVESSKTVSNAKKAHDEGILIYTIGVGLSDTRELDQIASPPSRINSFKVDNFDELRDVDERIFASACPKIFTMRTPTTTTTTTTTTTPPTTTPRRTTTTTQKRIPVYSPTGTDLIMMLDSTVDERRFKWMTNFVQDFVEQVDIDSGKWRIGAMTFDSSTPRRAFHLSDYNFRDEVIAEVQKMKNKRSTRSPRVGRAFDYVKRNMFNDRNGDRPLARNYIIMLTGNEKSYNTRESYAAARRLKDLGTDIYTIGLNVRNSTELDVISSRPISEHQMLVDSMSELGEVPGIFIYSMKRAPAPYTRTTPTATTTTTTPRPTVRYTGDCKAKGDVVFLLDTSGSVGQDNFMLMRDFVKSVIRDLEIDQGFFRIGLITFSDTSRVEFNLNAYNTLEEISNALDRIEYVYGSTNTAEGLRRVRTDMLITMNGDRLDVPNMVIIVSDGQSNINHIETIPEARRLKATGTTILTVGVGVAQNAELKGMASPPVDKNFIEVMNFEDLHTVTQSMIAPLCTDDNMCSRDPCQNEAVCVDGLRSYMCVCQPGFYGDNCEKVCGPPADVVLILDSSTSVGPVNFGEIKSYAQQLVSEMEVLNCGIHVGVLKYSSAAMIQFNLGTLDTEEEINRAIEGISYTRGRSNMAEAIRVVRTMMFNGVNGDRYDARNIAYLITDGTTEINREGTQMEAELIIDAGTRLIPIAVGLRDRRELEVIASQQGIQLMEIDSETKLMEMKDQVLEAVYDLNNRCNPNPCENNGQCVNEPMGFRCECPAGFTGDVCEKSCNGKADIVFVVDSSRYNSGRDFRAIKRFLRDVVKRMAFRGENFRVAVVSYGAVTRLRLHLADGNKKRAVKSAISSLRRVSGDPAPEQAMLAVNYNIINKGGDRENAENYVVFVTRRVGSHKTVAAINKIKSKGSRVIGVGIQLSDYEQNLLKAAVSAPLDKSLYLADSAEDLEPMSTDFVQFVCEDTNQCAENPCQNNGICVNGEKSYACKCPNGFAGKNCERTCDDRADIVFIIDSSGSVGFDNFRRVKEYITYIVDNLNIGSQATRVGVITFSDKSRINIFLNSHTDKRKLQAAIAGISYEYGNTNTAEAINMARSGVFVTARGDRPDVPNFIVLITDGLSNVHSERTIPEAESARKDGIHIFAIGVGISEPYELENVASKPADRNVFRIQTYVMLSETSGALLDKTCRDNSICQQKNPCMNGGICVPEVGHYSCKCRAGYQGDKCEMDCSEEKDIAIIMDSSASVGSANFKTMLMFVKSLIKSLTASGQNHRFAFITYNTGVKTIFSFDRYSRPEDIIQAVETTTYTSGSSNTADGLRKAKQLFGRDFGARRSADSLAILLTDGQSNVNYWDTVPAADELKAANVRVIGIGIALTRFEEINSIASSTSDVYQVSSFEALEDTLPIIVQESCASSK